MKLDVGQKALQCLLCSHLYISTGLDSFIRIPACPDCLTSYCSVCFSWLTPLLHLGKKKRLEESDMYRILPEDRSQTLGEELQRCGTQRICVVVFLLSFAVVSKLQGIIKIIVLIINYL